MIRTATLWLAALALAATTGFLGVALALKRDDVPPTTKTRPNPDLRRLEAQAAELRALFDTITAHRNTPFATDARPRVREAQNNLLRMTLACPAYDAALTAADRLSAYVANSASTNLHDSAERALSELDAALRTETKR